MYSLDTIFISLTLLILSGVLIKIRSSKAIIPLAVIYIFFLYNKLSIEKIEVESKIDDKKTKIKSTQSQNKLEIGELGKDNQVPIFTNKDVSFDKKIMVDKKSINQKEKEKTVKKEKKVEKEKNIKIRSDKPKNVTKVKEKKQTLNNLVKLKEIKICRNIKNRSPIGVGEIFPSSVDSLYCYTKIENLGKKMEVRHVWYYENQIMTQVRYNVKKSNVYRSWTKKTISSFQIGNWRVEVQDRNGTIIGKKQFKIKKPS